MIEKAIKLFKDKKAVAGVIGLGYVGLPLVKEFVRSGFKTIGFDVDPKKVKSLNKGQSYILHIPSKDIKPMVKDKMFSATEDFSRLKEADVLAICVPTPLTKWRDPDLSYVEQTTEVIAKTLRKGQVIILESTTYPGTTDELMLPILEKTGLKAGKDFFLAFSPEREDPGNPIFNTRTIPKVLGGLTPSCMKVSSAFYEMVFDEVIKVSSTRTAELTKLLENIYRSVNIALINEMKMVADKMDIDIWEVIEAAKTKPFGFTPFYPGPGLGGHCIPIDPFYLTWKAREYDMPTRFIELAGEVNTSMPEYVVEKTIRGLCDKGVPIKGAKVLIVGVAYKKDVDDVRETPALKVIELLRQRGIKVSYYDPYIPKYPAGRKGDPNLSSIKLTPASLKKVDAALIITAHTEVNYQTIVDNAPLVIDTRNATAGIKRGKKKIIKA